MAPSKKRYTVSDADNQLVRECLRVGFIKEDYDYPELVEKAKVGGDPSKNRETLAKMIMQAQLENEQASENYKATKKTAATANKLITWGSLVALANIPFGLFNFWPVMIAIAATGIGMIAFGIHMMPDKDGRIRIDRTAEIEKRHKLDYLYGVKVEQYANDKQIAAGA